jgi:hypothetical protein
MPGLVPLSHPGAEMPGGRIDVKYLSDGKESVAADTGDYIYPADVRFDQPGSACTSRQVGCLPPLADPQTWLFEYDLRTWTANAFARLKGVIPRTSRWRNPRAKSHRDALRSAVLVN